MSTTDDHRYPVPLMRSNRTQQLNNDRRSAVNENRKSNKPLLEKKRRARINRSLDQLKNLLMDVMKNDASTSYSKLEKADILEMTVKHLRQMQANQMTGELDRSSVLIHRYQTGFNECAQEVNRYLLSIDGLQQPEVRLRLMTHLAECITAPQPQPIHCSSVDHTTTSLRINPPPTQFSDTRCVIDSLPVTCSNVIRPLTSQMSPVAMEQLRLREVIGMATSSYDVTRLSEGGCVQRVNRVVAHAHRRGDDSMGGEMMGEEFSLEDGEVLTTIPVLIGVRRTSLPLGERNNDNWKNISLNSASAVSSSTVSSSCSSPHQLGDDDGEEKVQRFRSRGRFLRGDDHLDEMDVTEEEEAACCWRPW